MKLSMSLQLTIFGSLLPGSFRNRQNLSNLQKKCVQYWTDVTPGATGKNYGLILIKLNQPHGEGGEGPLLRTISMVQVTRCFGLGNLTRKDDPVFPHRSIGYVDG